MYSQLKIDINGSHSLFQKGKIEEGEGMEKNGKLLNIFSVGSQSLAHRHGNIFAGKVISVHELYGICH